MPSKRTLLKMTVDTRVNQIGVAKLRMGCTMALYVSSKVSVKMPHLNPGKAFMTLRALDARSIATEASGHEHQRCSECPA